MTIFEKGSSETWSSAMFVQRLLSKYCDDPKKTAEITELIAATEIANEFLATVI